MQQHETDSTPQLIALVGGSGAGKTWLAHACNKPSTFP